MYKKKLSEHCSESFLKLLDHKQADTDDGKDQADGGIFGDLFLEEKSSENSAHNNNHCAQYRELDGSVHRFHAVQVEGFT